MEEQPYCEAQVGGLECGRPVEQWGHQCERHDPEGITRRTSKKEFEERKEYKGFIYCENCLCVVGETDECLCLVDNDPCCMVAFIRPLETKYIGDDERE